MLSTHMHRCTLAQEDGPTPIADRWSKLPPIDEPNSWLGDLEDEPKRLGPTPKQWRWVDAAIAAIGVLGFAALAIWG